MYRLNYDKKYAFHAIQISSPATILLCSIILRTVTHTCHVIMAVHELAFNTTTNKAILNGVSYEEIYYISVCGINAISKGKVTTTTFTNGV